MCRGKKKTLYFTTYLNHPHQQSPKKTPTSPGVSAATFENDLTKLGSADIANAKEKEKVVKKWTAQLNSAPRRSAPGGDTDR